MSAQFVHTTIIVDLEHLGLLCVEGPAAAQFLQGQLTCDVNDISPQLTRLGAHCNPQGRIISLFRIFIYQEKYYLQMLRELIPIALQALKKYAVFFKVQLHDASMMFKQIGYCGPNLANFYETLPAQVDAVTLCNNTLIIKVPGSSRYEIIGPSSIFSCSDSKESWHHLNLCERIPFIYPATAEKFLPHEINLPQLNGVSFNKGCYTGQEIIARIQYRGKLKKQLTYYKLCSEHQPIHGNDFCHENNEGMVVDFCQLSPNEFALLLL